MMPVEASGETLSVALVAGDPERVALKTPDRRVEWTAATLAEQVERLAGALSAAGVGRGDCVALMLPNGPEFVQFIFAVASVGAAAAPLNPAYTTDECAFYLNDLAAKVIVVPAAEGSAARRAAGEVGLLEARSASGSVTLLSGGRPLQGSRMPPLATADDIALLLHTSGTTSRPKQVPLLHRNLVASARTIADHYALGADDVSFAAMPLFHVHGLVASVLAQLIAGGTVVVPERLSSRDFWAALRDEAVTWFSGSPTVLTMLLDRCPKDSSAPALRFARSCSAPLARTLADRVETEVGVPIVQAYGMTEASHQVASNPLPPERRDPSSVGVATGARLTALDAAGVELACGAVGEIAVQGPGVMSGYLNNPDANAAAFSGGWFRTGDLGVVDAHGYVRLDGRIKELINRGGEKISPYEVEEVLRSHRAVVDVACFAVPDEKYGEVVGAAVVLRSATESRELVAFCEERLAAFKTPRLLVRVDSLPKTATGKVLRYKLAAEFAAR